MKRCFFILTFLSVLLWPIYSSADLVSTFDSGTEGWTTEGHTHGLYWDDSDGNPPGSVYARDDRMYEGWWFFVAPSSWNGNWSQYEGGTLSFDLRVRDSGGSPSPDNYIVWIKGSSGEELTWGMDSEPPATSWTNYQITLNPETFGVSEDDFDAVMSDVVELKIRGEYWKGSYEDEEGLDNVRVSAVPVPGAVWLLGSGLIGFVALGRKRLRG